MLNYSFKIVFHVKFLIESKKTSCIANHALIWWAGNKKLPPLKLAVFDNSQKSQCQHRSVQLETTATHIKILWLTCYVN